MKRSSKAALLSGLIFPGIGHMLLKHYYRGVALVLMALVAFSVIATSIVQRALTVIDRINSGEIAVGTDDIAQLISNSSSGANNFMESTAVIVLGACWLIGVIDSYRLGVAQEKILGNRRPGG